VKSLEYGTYGVTSQVQMRKQNIYTAFFDGVETFYSHFCTGIRLFTRTRTCYYHYCTGMQTTVRRANQEGFEAGETHYSQCFISSTIS